MPKKYSIRFIWEKYIDFPPIEAKDRKEAKEKTEAMLCGENDLYEENGKEHWEIKKEKGQ